MLRARVVLWEQACANYRTELARRMRERSRPAAVPTETSSDRLSAELERLELILEPFEASVAAIGLEVETFNDVVGALPRAPFVHS